MKFENYIKYDDVSRLLSESGWPLSSDAVNKIDAHLQLIQLLGRSFGVVSDGDIRRGAFDHVVDSLSVVPHLGSQFREGACYVDVGSGGGFPGLICAILFPDAETVLIERSGKKCAFLRRCVAEIGLRNTEVREIPFQDFGWGERRCVAMVRGLERAEKSVPELVERLSPGSCCIWLTGPNVPVEFGSRFHVEQIVDNWSKLGLRRGLLYSISVP